MRRGVGLQAKLLVALLVVSLVPLAVTAVLVGNIGRVAQNFAANHVAELRPHLEAAQDAHKRLIAAKKQEFQQTVRRMAKSPELLESAQTEVGASLLKAMLSEHPEMLRIELVDRSGLTLSTASRVAPLNPALTEYRELRIRQETGRAGVELVAIFAADLAPVADLRALGEALSVSRRVDTVESSLPNSYRIAFLLLIGSVVVVVTFVAWLSARRIVRRISQLVEGTRQVASGDLEAAVDLEGSDELAELGIAFNKMLDDLKKERQKILYLQRIGAWQDIARKLAHEIKNPLTPIQLVVQQVVSSYDGESERYQKLLSTCGEIVGEEIEGLRRLVDAFRDLGRLPKVEAVELKLSTIVEDLKSDPTLSEFLVIDSPPEEVSVSADRLLLRRAVVNLVENGMHAGQEAGNTGMVTLRWRAVGASALLTIDDEGKGVPDAKREAIFDPYETSKETGTGLGLAIAKKVALDHQGNLRLSPDLAPTGGARFLLEIPLISHSS